MTKKEPLVEVPKKKELPFRAVGKHQDEKGHWVVSVLEYDLDGNARILEQTSTETGMTEFAIDLFKRKVVDNGLIH